MEQIRPQMVPFESPETAGGQAAPLSPRMLIENSTGPTRIPPRGRTEMPTLLTPDEVSSILGISKTTLYRIVARRVLRFFRISGMLRFDQRDVEEFIKRGLVEPVSAKEI